MKAGGSGIAPLIQHLKRNIMPKLDAPFDLTKLAKAIATSQMYSVLPFFSMTVYIDIANTTRYRINLRQGGLVLPSREYYSENDIMETYKSSMKKMLLPILEDVYDRSLSVEEIDESVEAIISLERHLAGISMTKYVL